MSIIGLDIGYGNLKVTYGSAGSSPRSQTFPAGAGPLARASSGLTSDGPTEGYRVQVNGEDWVAGIPLHHLEGWARELHDNFPSSDTYQALAKAGLAATHYSSVDHLVTGLPVAHFNRTDLRDSLTERLTGNHELRPGLSPVEVHKVTVLPQPAGAFMALLESSDDVSVIEEGLIIVVDPGFFSVDWVVMQEGMIRPRSSGTSLKAMSAVQDLAVDLLCQQYGKGISRSKVESALRAGNTSILYRGARVSISDALDKAATEIAHIALTELRSSLRDSDEVPDVVLLAGGGANLYEKAAQEAFPGSNIFVPPEPVTANSRGFWYFGGQA